MHEGNFTKHIVDSILEEIKAVPNGSVRRVAVSVGEMLHLDRESVLTHFRCLAVGTPLENIQLALSETPVQIVCKMCGWGGKAEDHHILYCSHCDSGAVEIISGRDVTIDHIEIDDIDSAGSEANAA